MKMTMKREHLKSTWITQECKVREAYAKMHKVWDSQNVSGKLVTKLYDAPHEFNQEMQ